jgi:hypothetical protein
MEIPMEARIARLEAGVTHLRTDVADSLDLALEATVPGTMARGFAWI